MNRDLLQSWLCGPDAPVITPAEIAAVLGVHWETVRDTTLLRVADRLRAVHFTVLVLRDVFADDRDVRRWLRTPRAELGGGCPADCLRAGRTAAVEELAVHEWRRGGGEPVSAARDGGCASAPS